MVFIFVFVFAAAFEARHLCLTADGRRILCSCLPLISWRISLMRIDGG